MMHICRIMRDRALYKVNCDFVDAAKRGAKGVIGRCISPINPTDPERFHM
jgi:protein TIF31